MTATRRPPRDAALLATLAEPLAPTRAPFYVSGSDTGHPDGWYWTPGGAKQPTYLGRNVLWAERRLLEHLRASHNAAA